MEFTGQAFEEMQEQNVRLLQQLREKDDANLKLMSEVRKKFSRPLNLNATFSFFFVTFWNSLEYSILGVCKKYNRSYNSKPKYKAAKLTNHRTMIVMANGKLKRQLLLSVLSCLYVF